MENLADIPKMETELKMMVLAKFSIEQLRKVAVKLGMPIFHNNMDCKRYALISKISNRLTLNEIFDIADKFGIDYSGVKRQHESMIFKIKEMYDQLITENNKSPVGSIREKDDTLKLLNHW